MAKYESDIPVDVVTDGEQASTGIEVMSTPADFNPEDIEAAEEVSDLANTKTEVDAVEGLEVDKDLNKTTFSYTPGQCARVSTGTQNYCPFAGSGR